MEFFTGVIRLSRYKEVLAIVAVLSIMGMFLVASNNLGEPSLDVFILVFLGNFLATTFAFMINDVEDAEDDARDPKKAQRNPISAGMLTHRQGTIVSWVVALASLALFALLGAEVLLAGTVLVILGFLYSWRTVRLKGMPFIDMISHGYFLASGILLTAFLSVSGFDVAVLPAFFAVFFLSLAGDMFNEIRDYESDRKANLKNTVSVLGLQASIGLRIIFTFLGIILALVVAATNLDSLNLPATIVGIVSVVILAVYMQLIAKRSVLDYDNAMFYNTLLTVIFAVLAISTSCRSSMIDNTEMTTISIASVCLAFSWISCSHH